MHTLLMVIDSSDPFEARFDKRSSSWSNMEFGEYNWLFLRTQQNWANDLLRARGYLFLNDVLNVLGLPSTKEGQIVGWVYEKTEEPDPSQPGFISFGCWDEESNPHDADLDGGIELNFNVQGPILHALA